MSTAAWTAAAWPDHLLSLRDWDQLPEDSRHRVELVEGTLQVSPRPIPDHQRAQLKLGSQLLAQLPSPLEALPEVEVILFDAHPPTVRVPDIVISARRPGPGAARLAAAEVVLACEIASPGSIRTDRLVKPGEYADAGIPHYWLLDLTAGSLSAFDLHNGSYRQVSTTTSGLTVTEPAALTIDVAALLG